MQLLNRVQIREVLGIPAPRILASSFDSSNAVGAEYIIEEKARGKPLGSLWNQWSMESRLDIVSQIIDFERRLTSVSFPKHGCIYYKADLERRGIATESLTNATDNLPLACDRSVLDSFAMGPLTEGRLWEAERAKMVLDRGPCKSKYGTRLSKSDPSSGTTALEYLNALGKNEIQWVKSYARPRMNFHRSMESPEMPDDFLSLLTRYMKLAPYLVPKPLEETCVKTLSHPDLHLDNIFVDPTTREITTIVDWQSASVSEVFLQRAFPPMLSHSDLQHPESDKGQSQDLPSQYKHLTETCNSRRWTILKEDRISILIKPVSLLCGAWDREDVFSFRHALIAVVAHWKQIVPDSTPCPVHFTELELELHGKEMELIEGLGTIMHQLQEENMIPLGGMV